MTPRSSSAVPDVTGEEGLSVIAASPAHCNRACSSAFNTGGARWVTLVVSTSPSEVCRKNRSGDPGRVVVPSVSCSTSMSRRCDLVCSHSYTSSRVRTLPAGMPASASLPSRVSASVAAKAFSTSSMTWSRWATRSAFVARPAVLGVDVERRTELLPQTLAADRDLHGAVGAAEQSVRGDGRVMVALGVAHLAGDRPPGALEGVHPDDAAQQRGAHQLSAAGGGPFDQPGQHADHPVQPGEQVADRHTDPLRVVRTGSGQRHQTGLALGDLVVAGPAAFRSVVPESGDRQGDQARIELGQAFATEAQPGEHPRPEVLQQHIGFADQLRQRCFARLLTSGPAQWIPCCGCRTGSRSTRGTAQDRRG